MCQLSVYRALSGKFQEIVLQAVHITPSTYINAVQMSRFELVFGQNVFGHYAVRTRGFNEQHHSVSFEFSLHKLLRHLQPRKCLRHERKPVRREKKKNETVHGSLCWLGWRRRRGLSLLKGGCTLLMQPSPQESSLSVVGVNETKAAESFTADVTVVWSKSAEIQTRDKHMQNIYKCVFTAGFCFLFCFVKMWMNLRNLTIKPLWTINLKSYW